jgi:hypothetical protein
MNTLYKNLALILTVAALSCASGEPSPNNSSVSEPMDFDAYWNQGKAEISTYKLSQARYGELREGTAVSVFVTEPWNEAKMVKSDRDGDFSVMKLNLTKNFVTGIYPYSMMTSAFTPIDAENGDIQKVTCSSQEWCGQSFDQLNRLDDGSFESSSYSYFESEGDEIENIEEVLLEDEIWNRIRLNPEALPEGEIEMLPSTMYLRLSHAEVQAYSAQAELSKTERYWIYTIQYPSLQRSISYRFGAKFPYSIQSWEEVYRDGFGSNAKELKTSAELITREMIDYWNKNSNADRGLRKELGLE